MYVQQGYVFGHVGLCMYVCMYVYILYVYMYIIYNVYNVDKNAQKRGLICQGIRSGKEIWNQSINGTGERF